MAPQKRPAADSEAALDGVKVILLDIEGTTTPTSFVKDTLFPYVKENLNTYLTNHYDEDDCTDDINSLRDLAKKDKEANVDGAVEIPESDAGKEAVIKAVVENVTWQMGEDRKSTELKILQGRLWREAYKQGKVRGELYEDVVPALRQLVDDGFQLYVYSSGSVEAQKLLFSHTEDGDIVKLFSGFFDNKIGSKLESDSYKKIAEEVNKSCDEVLFLTDLPAEGAAAVKAGMKCTLVAREGEDELSEEDRQNYSVIETFSELVDLDDDVKRPATEGNGSNAEGEDGSNQ